VFWAIARLLLVVWYCEVAGDASVLMVARTLQGVCLCVLRGC